MAKEGKGTKEGGGNSDFDFDFFASRGVVVVF